MKFCFIRYESDLLVATQMEIADLSSISYYLTKN